MSGTSSKTRTQRLATLTAIPNRLSRTIHTLQRRDVILRCLALLGTLGILVVFLQIWNPPFRYYVGAPINRDIVARVPFSTFNQEETDRMREQAGMAVPYVFVRTFEDEPLFENINQLMQVLDEARKCESFDDLPSNIQEQFLPPEGGTALPSDANFFHFLRNKPKPVPVVAPVSVPVPALSSAPVTEPAPTPEAVKSLEPKKVEPAKVVEPPAAESLKNETPVEGGKTPAGFGITETLPVPAAPSTIAQTASRLAAQPELPATSESAEVPAELETVVPPVPAPTVSETAPIAAPVVETEEDRIRIFCDKIEEAMRPFSQRGLVHSSEIEDDPDNRGLQSQINIVTLDEDEHGIEFINSKETVRKTDVIIEHNEEIRRALRGAVGSDEGGDRIYYWVCRKWKSNLRRDSVLTRNAISDAENSVALVEKRFEISQRIVSTTVLPTVQETPDGAQNVPILIGTTLTAPAISLLRIENAEWLRCRTLEQQILRTTAILFLILVLCAPLVGYVVLAEPRIMTDFRRLSFLLSFSLLAVLSSVSLSTDTMRYGLFPLVIYGQMVTIQYNRRVGMTLAGVLLIFLAVGVGMTSLEVLHVLSVLMVTVLPLGRLRGRMQFVKIGFAAMVVSFLLTCTCDILMSVPLEKPTYMKGFYNGLEMLLCGLVIQGLIPLLERFFGVLSDVRLLELCDINNPLLSELINRAPSTYNHSIALGTIAENAADAIGADGLLCRAAAYYHDIGKIYKPKYYSENQAAGEESPHNALEPTMSALIIIAHVKNGIDLARQYRLPQQIIDLIEQHHGTTLVQYFYVQACNRAKEDPSAPEVEESSFRYPCSRPQTKEAVVLMLADACESACRSLVDPAPAKIENLVRKLSQQRLEDEQFDESGITLCELRTVEDNIIKGLISYHHGRTKYPEKK